jgi:hypothetical protein
MMLHRDDFHVALFAGVLRREILRVQVARDGLGLQFVQVGKVGEHLLKRSVSRDRLQVPDVLADEDLVADRSGHCILLVRTNGDHVGSGVVDHYRQWRETAGATQHEFSPSHYAHY